MDVGGRGLPVVWVDAGGRGVPVVWVDADASGDVALSCLDVRGHGWACYEIRTHSPIGHVR